MQNVKLVLNNAFLNAYLSNGYPFTSYCCQIKAYFYAVIIRTLLVIQ